MQTGDSSLLAPSAKEITGLSVRLADSPFEEEITDSNTATFHFNSLRRLATAKLVVRANDFVDAERYAHDVISPILSRWSFENDVAIDVAGCELIETRTDSKKYRFCVTGQTKFVSADPSKIFAITTELRRLLSAYREGANADNVFFQLLSFYKVTEGIGNIRNRRNTEAKKRGRTPERIDEKIPGTLSEIPQSLYDTGTDWAKYLGRKFNFVLDDLRGTIRNAVTHIDPEKDVLSIDRFDDVDKGHRALPLLRYIARTMLMNKINRTAPIPTSGDVIGEQPPS